MRLSYVALPLLSSALLLVACGDDASNGGGVGAAGSSGASGKGGSAGTTSKAGASGAGGSAAGSSSKGGSAGSTSKGGSAGSTSKGGSAGSTSKGGSAGSTSKGGAGGEGGGEVGGEGGTSAGGNAGTSAGGKAGNTTGGAAGSATAGSAGSSAGGEAGRAGEGGTAAGGEGGEGGASAGGSSAGGAAGDSAGGTSAGGTSAGGEGGTSAGGTSAGGTSAGGTSAGGAAGTSAGGTSAGGSAGAGGAPPVVCREVTVTSTSATVYDDRIVFEFANIGGALRDAGGLFLDEKPAPGAYVLGSGINADPNTAKQIMAGYEDTDATTGVPKVLYASTGGTLNVSAAASTLRVKGTLTDVTLTEATAVGNTITVKPGGQCLHIASVAFDTSTYCASGSDCAPGNGCDPVTNTCKPQCTLQTNCAIGQSCLTQLDGGQAGACYSTCRNTFGATCGGSSSCNPFNYAGEGYCIDAGTIPEGGACAGQSDTTTDCAPGLVCVQDVPGSTDGVCRATCANLDADPKCPSGRLCLWGGYCTARNDVISPAQVGQVCAVEGQGCNADSAGPLGLCVTSGIIPQTICRQIVVAPGNCSGATPSFFQVSPGRPSNGSAGVATGVCLPAL